MYDSTITSEEAYYYYNTYCGPLGVFSAVVCGIAVITSYIFPKQRRFPNVAMVWTCVADLVFSAYIAMKWMDGPIKTHYTDTISSHSPAICRFSIYILNVFILSSAVLNVMLAVILYALLIKNIEARRLERYYCWFVGLFWGIVLFLPLLGLVDLLSPPPKGVVGYCRPSSRLALGLKIAPWLVLLITQIAIMIPVFRYVYKTTVAVQERTPSQTHARGHLWLYLRFIGIQCNQLIFWFPGMLLDTCALLDIPVKRSFIVLSAISIGFLSINGFIVLCGNKTLRKALQVYFTKVYTITKTKIRHMHKENFSNTPPLNI